MLQYFEEELAREELNLLAKLIGTETDARRRDTFRLNLFDGDLGDEEEGEQQQLPPGGAGQGGATTLSRGARAARRAARAAAPAGGVAPAPGPGTG